jgi:carbonic anhydrase
MGAWNRLGGAGVRLGRRRLLAASTLLAAPALLAPGLGGPLFSSGAARADALTREQRDAMTPDQIIALMKEGNQRFRRGEPQTRDYLREQRATAGGQFPAAVILSCIDSRAPAEVILDLGIGDVFNSRIAGCVADEDVIGGMEFACKLAGAKVVLVMGHTACGAVKGAIDDAKLGNLTALLAKIRPAVAATEFKGERSSSNPAFVDAVAQKHVELTVAQIRSRSPVLQELEARGAIKLTAAMYDLGTATVDFIG